MKTIDFLYAKLISKILKDGYFYKDKSRNIVMKQISSYNFKYNITDLAPLLKYKKVFWKKALVEMLWMLKGRNDLNYLHENNVHIWDQDFANNNGEGGPIYGVQWRSWSSGTTPIYSKQGMSSFTRNIEGFRKNKKDQLDYLINGLKTEPMSRRHIVTAWNPAELEYMALPPCHWSFEILVKPLSPLECLKYGKKSKPIGNDDLKFQTIEHSGYGFTLKWHQRSVDTFLGLPFNIFNYWFLGQLISIATGYKFLSLEGDLSNIHIYANHLPAIEKYLSNVSRKDLKHFEESKPSLTIDCGIKKELEIDFISAISIAKPTDFGIINYESADYIKANMIAKKNKN